MLIAFASSDRLTIDSHFASAPSFEIYKFGSDGQEISHTSLVTEITEESNDKVDAQISLLQECAIVYCTQIGGPAAARLVQSGIHPMKVPEGTMIVEELNRLNKLLLSKKLPPWLKKKLYDL
ncbi:MAG: NifB/NifX family molybdenum-iron cluster-binding protein [Desulfitobacteriaceae bacterium]